jgi:hypothetical protein
VKEYRTGANEFDQWQHEQIPGCQWNTLSSIQQKVLIIVGGSSRRRLIRRVVLQAKEGFR